MNLLEQWVMQQANQKNFYFKKYVHTNSIGFLKNLNSVEHMKSKLY